MSLSKRHYSVAKTPHVVVDGDNSGDMYAGPRGDTQAQSRTQIMHYEWKPVLKGNRVEGGKCMGMLSSFKPSFSQAYIIRLLQDMYIDLR